MTFYDTHHEVTLLNGGCFRGKKLDTHHEVTLLNGGCFRGKKLH